MLSWRRTFYSLVAAQFISMAGFAFCLPFLPFFIVKELHVADDPDAVRWTGNLMAAVGLPMALFSLVWGYLSDRYGRKIMVLRAMAGGTVIMALMAAVTNVHQLLVLRILQGILTGTVSASIALVASVTPKERSGYTLGMMQAAVLGGASIGPIVGGYAASLVGFRGTFIVGAALTFIGALLVKFGAEENFSPAVEKETGANGSYSDLFATPGFLIVMFALFQIYFANTDPLPAFALFVHQLSGQDYIAVSAITGQIICLAGLAEMISAWYFGRLADGWGHKRMVICGCLAAGLVSLPQAFAQNVGQMYVLRVLFGLAVGGVIPSLNAIIRHNTPEKDIGKAFGVTSFVAGSAFFLGPMAGGYLAAYTGSYRPPFILCGAVLLLAAALVAWRLKPSSGLRAATTDLSQP